MDAYIKSGLSVVTAIIVLAIVAVILSPNAKTPQVIQSLASFLGNVISAAVAPVSKGQ